ncbi:hypothetical protein [Aliikangiella maris]|uniref:Uncharacterized protein n=2 Tax=Aliikangiella maris TaxID=3162458 RepID=A0ABV3MUW6_9GAMM
MCINELIYSNMSKYHFIKKADFGEINSSSVNVIVGERLLSNKFSLITYYYLDNEKIITYGGGFLQREVAVLMEEFFNDLEGGEVDELGESVSIENENLYRWLVFNFDYAQKMARSSKKNKANDIIDWGNAIVKNMLDKKDYFIKLDILELNYEKESDHIPPINFLIYTLIFYSVTSTCINEKLTGKVFEFVNKYKLNSNKNKIKMLAFREFSIKKKLQLDAVIFALLDRISWKTERSMSSLLGKQK